MIWPHPLDGSSVGAVRRRRRVLDRRAAARARAWPVRVRVDRFDLGAASARQEVARRPAVMRSPGCRFAWAAASARRSLGRRLAPAAVWPAETSASSGRPASRLASPLREASNRRIDPATAALSDPTAPFIGMRMNASQRRRTAGPGPCPRCRRRSPGPAQVDLAGGQRRLAVGADDADAMPVEVARASPAGRRPGTAGGARQRRPRP